MKQLLIALLITIPLSLRADDGTEQASACNKITCNDLAPQERYHCLEQKKLCHRRAFAVQLEEWKKTGIEKNRRKSVLEALEGALGKNKQVISRLEKEIKELSNDMKEIEVQIQSVRKLKTKN